MSHIPNTLYKETVFDLFEEALQEKDWNACENFIAAVRSNGFPQLAQELDKVFAEAKADDESKQEPDDYTHANGIQN